MVGTFIITDDNGVPLTGLGAGDIELTEDGLPIAAGVSVSCPAPVEPTPMSVSFVIDRSGSMLAPLPTGATPLDVTLSGMNAFFTILDFPPPTAVSITGFNEQAYLVSDFRSSAAPLLAALGQLMPDGGTLFDPAFLDPMIGGIDLLSTRPPTVRRVLVFITDGEPNEQPSVQAIIDDALANNVEIHVITVGSRMTRDLQMIAQATGGRAYGNITDPGRLSAILGTLALPSRGLGPCRIQWRSEISCASESDVRTVSLSVPSEAVTASASYSVPAGRRVALRTSDNVLWFGTTSFPDVSTRQIVIEPENSPITITGESIDDADHFRVTSWGGTAPPFTLGLGEKRTITIEFAPTDTGGYGATLTFDGTPCPSASVILSGGDRLPGGGRAPLVLESPIGGEAFDACDSVTIRWGGVEPEQAVRIHYSTDDGLSWREITDSAVGYTYNWFPPGPGENYRIKVTTDAAEQNIIYTIAGGGMSTGDDIFSDQVRIVSPQGLEVWGDSIYIAESGLNRIRTTDMLSRIVGTAAGTGTSGNGGDGGPATRARFITPTDMELTTDRMFIADMNGYKIRVVDRATGIVSTYAGTGAIGFSPDGTDIRSGNLRLVNRLTADGDYLYLSELSSVTDTSNDRVRRIDMRTGVITTVAGGGMFYDSDGGSGLQALLRTPSGIAVRDGQIYFAERDAARVRRVDLKSGMISTVAGNGTAGFSGDGGTARSAMLSSPTDVHFIGDRLFISEGTNGNRIRVVDMKSGLISTFAGTGLSGFSGDSGAARNARLNEPAAITQWKELLLISDRFNERIRAVTLYRPDGVDSSGASFSIVAPRLEVSPALSDKRLIIDPVGVGAVSNTIATALICNSGNAPLVLDSATVEGTNADEFRVVGGLSDIPILPGECRTITLQFSPKGEGVRSAEAIFHGACSTPDTLALEGRGLPDCGGAQKEVVDFGSLVLGEGSSDSTITGTFCNDGTTQISGSVSLWNGGGVFSIVTGSGPFTLDPGECLDVTVRFRPTEALRTTAVIDFGISEECGHPQTILFGRGLSPQKLEAENRLLAAARCPDDAIDTTVTLGNSGEAPLIITGLSFTVNNEGFSIQSPLPTPGSPMTILPGAEEDIAIRLAPTSAGNKRGVLRIESNDPSGDVDVSIDGRRDSLRLAPDVRSIMVQRLPGQSYPHDTTVILTNTGDRSMTVTGATLSGADPAFFAVPSGQFPLTLLPGSSESVALQILQPADDRAYSASIALAYEQNCGLPDIDLDIRLSGTGPALAAESMVFPAILCDDGTGRDSTIVIGNFGGNTLRIDGLTIQDNPDGIFSADADLPLSIPPGGSATINVSFDPSAAGSYSARIRLSTNTEDGFEEIDISGTMERVSFIIAETELGFEPSAPGPNDMTASITNTGTVPLTPVISGPVGPYTIVSLVPQTIPPGGSSILTVRYAGPPEGAAPESISITEEVCGSELTLGLRTVAEDGGVRIWLPHDSAYINDPVGLPLRFSHLDGAPPTDSDTLVTTVAFTGGPFFFEALSKGDIIGRTWDPRTRLVTLTISVPYGARTGDTLTILNGTALLSADRFTPLTITDALWSRPTLTTETTDGSFLVLGTCFDPGINLIAREPQVERVRPNPSGGRIVVDLHLPDWAWLSGSLVDMNGTVYPLVKESYLEAGHHELTVDGTSLPDGLYILRFDTPHGSAETPVVIRR